MRKGEEAEEKVIMRKVLGYIVGLVFLMSVVQSLLIFHVSAVPIIPSPGVTVDKSSICCGDIIIVTVPVQNLRSETKYITIEIVIKDSAGNTIDSKSKSISMGPGPYSYFTWKQSFQIKKPCENFGTYTVEVTIKEDSIVHDTDTVTFTVRDCEHKPTPTPSPTSSPTPSPIPTPTPTPTPTCNYPPTVTFDKSTYYEGDTVYATVSTIYDWIYYEIKDCSGTVRESGYVSNGDTISYTIPSGTSECCYWKICFYWDEGGGTISPPIGQQQQEEAGAAGGGVTVGSYQCTKCYNFYVCPKTCVAYVTIEDKVCFGYDVYVDGVYQSTEGQGGTPDGKCTFTVSEGYHTIKIQKDGCSETVYNHHNFKCNGRYTRILYITGAIATSQTLLFKTSIGNLQIPNRAIRYYSPWR